jgi:tetratricopeptide (TPR) repeat protein
MTAHDLLRSHRYEEAIAEYKQALSANPNDFAAMGRMALALRALEKYNEALPLFKRLDAHRKESKIAPGSPGWQEDISCLYWFLGNRQKAIELMRGLVDGILDRSIQYGDLAGGMKQGLLLYYMAVTQRQPEQAACALDYMRNRINQLTRLLPPGIPVNYWPIPVARYYHGDLAFDELLTFATGQRDLAEAIEVARVKLLSRRQLCETLFHDGVRSRALGAEDRCLARMRECYGLEDPLLEPEWYLARHEVEQAVLTA